MGGFQGVRRRSPDVCAKAQRAQTTMGLKVRDNLFTGEVLGAIIVAMTAWIGMSISVAGLMQIPKCEHGASDCYFYVQICDTGLLSGNSSQMTCTWVSKNRKLESNSGDGLEQV